MADTPDIGSIVNMIMGNPELVEKIAGMARGARSEDAEPQASEVEAAVAEEANPTTSTNERRLHRARLAGAMKPYLSKERAQAIDAMLSIADILELTRGKI